MNLWKNSYALQKGKNTRGWNKAGMPYEGFECFSQGWNAGTDALVASKSVSDKGCLSFSMQLRMPICRKYAGYLKKESDLCWWLLER